MLRDFAGLHKTCAVFVKLVDQKHVLDTRADQRAALDGLVVPRHGQRSLENRNRPTEEREAIELGVCVVLEDDLRDSGEVLAVV
jgi:hypothetical protein